MVVVECVTVRGRADKVMIDCFFCFALESKFYLHITAAGKIMGMAGLWRFVVDGYIYKNYDKCLHDCVYFFSR